MQAKKIYLMHISLAALKHPEILSRAKEVSALNAAPAADLNGQGCAIVGCKSQVGIELLHTKLELECHVRRRQS